MERPHYRRVTGGSAPDGAIQDNPHKRSTFSERLVAQFIICGVIMAVILVINLISSSPAQNIKSVIQDQPTADEVKQVLTDASDTVKSIFANNNGANAADDFSQASDTPTSGAENQDSPAPSIQPSPAPAADTPQIQETASAPADFRIDEDILTQIQADSDAQ